MTETRTTLREHESELVVASASPAAEGVLELRLVDDSGESLPPWTPGAHVDLVLGDDLVRQYSLCGDPTDKSSFTVAVLRELESRGGSAYVHDQLAEGSRVTVRGPRNHFPLVSAPHYRFVAGGIGITPILPMIADGRGVRSRLEPRLRRPDPCVDGLPRPARGVRRPGQRLPDRRVRSSRPPRHPGRSHARDAGLRLRSGGPAGRGRGDSAPVGGRTARSTSNGSPPSRPSRRPVASGPSSSSWPAPG